MSDNSRNGKLITSSASNEHLEKHLKRAFPEWILLQKILKHLPPQGQVLDLGHSRDYSRSQNYDFPLTAIKFGSESPTAPVLAIFGGVHGLERIGSQVALSLLGSFSELLVWDKISQHALEHIKIIFFPIVNPIGVLNKSRCNPNGVDLMRNSPVEAEDASFLVGGHRYNSRLPWYRGPQGSPLEPEAQAIIDLFNKEIKNSPTVVSLDLHSGFGIHDRIWFPWAKSVKPFPQIAETYALKESIDQTFPHHFYKIEPQSLNYTTHGDIWDYTFEQYHNERQTSGVYLPLTLEMGSWLWVRKNPLQFFSMLGPYNPVKPHRQKRILRRHNTLFDFLIRSLISPRSWAHLNHEQKEKYLGRAMERWYPDLSSPEKYFSDHKSSEQQKIIGNEIS
jgi:hypothetical protein